MSKYRHRVAFNADLFMSLETDKEDTPIEELQRLAVAAIRKLDTGDELLTDIPLCFKTVNPYEMVAYVRQSGAADCPIDDELIKLENFTAENVEEE